MVLFFGAPYALFSWNHRTPTFILVCGDRGVCVRWELRLKHITLFKGDNFYGFRRGRPTFHQKCFCKFIFLSVGALPQPRWELTILLQTVDREAFFPFPTPFDACGASTTSPSGKFSACAHEYGCRRLSFRGGRCDTALEGFGVGGRHP